jgi:fluoride exporter
VTPARRVTEAGREPAEATGQRVDVDPFAGVRRSTWPRLRASVIGTVFVGGCAGGLVRYLTSQHWPTVTHLFPWPTFTVNVAGAFILTLLLVIATDVLGPTTYLRPLVGTGFCGALTTFSSVVVSADQLIAHGHAAVATAYLLASIAAGLAAAWLGLFTGRSFAAYRRRDHHEGAR